MDKNSLGINAKTVGQSEIAHLPEDFQDCIKENGLGTWSVDKSGLAAPLFYVVWNPAKMYEEYVLVEPEDYRDELNYLDYAIGRTVRHAYQSNV